MGTFLRLVGIVAVSAGVLAAAFLSVNYERHREIYPAAYDALRVALIACPQLRPAVLEMLSDGMIDYSELNEFSSLQYHEVMKQQRRRLLTVAMETGTRVEK